MSKKISFYKDGYEWFADVPFIPKANNLMVAGSDTFLESISGGRKRITLEIVASPSVKQIEESRYYLIMTKHDFWGGTYDVYGSSSDPMTSLWLCNVTHFVCGRHPKRIAVMSVS